ncbi:uncharacterized protein LOC136086206 [Hydra vulgaris]|uniref:Uncharacterized protein LOC136086206 n=1 Tax=Hydra vulgaris TaxID=6087 RepID=A0ABM4CRR6_HYDVU
MVLQGAASETTSEVSISDPIAKPKICTFLLKGSVAKKQSNGIKSLTIDEAQHNESEFLTKDYRRILSENINLKEKLLSFQITIESFTDDEKVLYYTGLPSSKVLLALFQHVEAYISLTALSQLSKFQKVILVLMKLRLGTPLQDLAFRFDISHSVASKTFKNILHILYVRMKPLIFWPERKELQQPMPLSFRQNFGLKIAVIKDCFEIFIEKPSNLMARAQTWSNYKSHNTVKYLIGIVPQGVISYISQGWGGRTSDKLITEQCGLLKKLNPGDVVLADRGFNIADSVGLMCAEVKIPAFTRGKKQLSAVDVESTRKIAHSRVNVERVIGLVRNKYTILKEILPVDFLMCEADNITTVDKIVTVSCALTNCCKSIVRFD